jgi:hypothetical protein
MIPLSHFQEQNKGQFNTPQKKKINNMGVKSQIVLTVELQRNVGVF